MVSVPAAGLSDHPDVEQVDPENKVLEKRGSALLTNISIQYNKRVSVGDMLRRQSLGFDNPSLSPLPTRGSGSGGYGDTPSAPSSDVVVVNRNAPKNGSLPPPPPPHPSSNAADNEEIPPAPPKRIHSIERSLIDDNNVVALSSGHPNDNLLPKLPPKKRATTPSNSSSGQ